MKKSNSFRKNINLSLLGCGIGNFILQSLLYILISTGMLVLMVVRNSINTYYGDEKAKNILARGLAVWASIFGLIYLVFWTIGLKGIAFLLMPKMIVPGIIALLIVLGKRRRTAIIDYIKNLMLHERFTQLKRVTKRIELAALFLK